MPFMNLLIDTLSLYGCSPIFLDMMPNTCYCILFEYELWSVDQVNTNSSSTPCWVTCCCVTTVHDVVGLIILKWLGIVTADQMSPVLSLQCTCTSAVLSATAVACVCGPRGSSSAAGAAARADAPWSSTAPPSRPMQAAGWTSLPGTSSAPTHALLRFVVSQSVSLCTKFKHTVAVISS